MIHNLITLCAVTNAARPLKLRDRPENLPELPMCDFVAWEAFLLLRLSFA
nr:hypothetical protein [uncultured Desulfobacter sp.]